LADTKTSRQPDAVLLAFLVVLTPLLLSHFFRRDLYAEWPGLYWAFDAVKFVILPTAALVYLARVHSIRPRHFGLRGVAANETWVHFIGLSVFLALILSFVYYGARYVAWAAIRPEVVSSFYNDINPDGLLRIPATLYLALSAGVAEEVFLRGLPLLYLERRFGDELPRNLYIFGTASVFGLIHWGNGPHEVIATFAFGLLAAVLYLRLKDLWPLIAAHTIIDIVGFA
jgi:membrane protease YdiL (CAAX protease family)